MKLSLKLAAVILLFGAFILPFLKPKPAEAAGCQLIVSTTEVVAHGSFNVTVQNGNPGIEYIIKYDSALNSTVFTMPSSGSYTATVNLDNIFPPGDPLRSSGSFLVNAGTTIPLGFPNAEACTPTSGILITVIAPPPPTVIINADSTNIDYNTATNLNWTSTNADSCTLNGTSVSTNGSQTTGNLTTTTTFTINCTNVSGSAQASVTVTVKSPPPPTCSPATQTVNIGVSANFTAGAGTGTFSWSASGGSPSTGSGSSFSTSYSTAGSKTVTVTSGSLTANCSVNVTTPPPTADIKANGSDGPISIAFNTTATLTWQSTNATSCSVSPGGYSGTTSSGQATTNLTSATTYTLTCTGPGGSKTDTVTINVNAPLACSYTFTPTTVDSGGTITVTITAGGSLDKFSAAIADAPPGTNVYDKQFRTGLGTITLNAPTVSTATAMVVAAADESASPAKLCGGASAITVNPPAPKWNLGIPIVTSNQLSVIFSFSPASNGNIGLIVDKDCSFSSFPRPFDSGVIANGQSQVTWNFPPPGSYCAELVFGTAVVSNTVTFKVANPPSSSWQLSLLNCSGNTAFFNISPAAGASSVLHINETGDEVTIPGGATSVSWTGPNTGSPKTYTAEIIYYAVQVSNQVSNITLPCNPPATQWTLSINKISGNDVTFDVQCPTKDCPGYGGGAVVIIKDLKTSNPVPNGGGQVSFPGLPNGSHQAVVVVFLSEESGVVDFTLPQKTDCGFIIFPGGAGVVSGPVNNCALASPGGVISAILPYVFGIAGFLSIIIIVISGIQFITSSGNPEAAASARGRLVFALIGLAVIILAFAILQIVDRLFLGGSGVS